MGKFNWRDIADAAGRALRQRSPEILTGVGISGMITTTVLAVKATPEALKRIEAKKEEEHHRKLTATQTVQAAWMCYIPAGITGTASTVCLVVACAVSRRRYAALFAAYGLAENTLRDYSAKVIETIGKNKESAVRDAMDRDRVEKNPPPVNTDSLPRTEGTIAPVLCMDAMFPGRYIYSDVESLRRAMNKLNWQMSTGSEPYISLNEFYIETGFEPVEIGDDLGWRTDRGLIDLRFSSQLVKGGTPCLVVGHKNPPEYGYADG